MTLMVVNPFYIVLLILCLLIPPASAQEKSFSLNQCIEYGLQHQTSITKHALNKALSEESYNKELSKLIPKVSLNSNLDHYWQIPVQVFPGEFFGKPEGTYVPLKVGTPYSAGISLDANIDLYNPATWQSIRTAAIRQQITHAENMSDKSILVEHIIKAYYAAVLQQNIAVFDSINLRNIDTLYTIAQKRFEDGVMEQLDLNGVKSILLEARQAARKSEGQYLNSLVQLKYWMGKPLQEELLPDAGLEGLTHTIKSTPAITVFDYNQHPGYNILSNKLLFAENDLNRNKLLRIPTISVYASYSKRAYTKDVNVFKDSDQWFNTGLVGIKLRVPLLGDQIRQQISLSRIEIRKAALEEKEFINEQQRNFAEQQHNLNTAYRNLELSGERLKLSLDNLEIAGYKFKKGLFSSTDLKNTAHEVIEAQQDYIHVVSDWFIANTEISYLTGKYNY